MVDAPRFTFWAAFLFSLAKNAHAYLPGTGSSVGGNLKASAPYGIPPDEFGNVTKRISSNATFYMTGYDVSTNAAASMADPGWTLTVAVTTDVSLIDAARSSQLDVEATTLSIEPPGGNTTIDPAWRICAVVFTGLANGTVSPSTTVDGTCGAVLSGACIQAIEAGSSGIDEGGNCTVYTLPSACIGDFPTASVNNTAFAINQTVLDEKRFYAYGSPPTQTGNITAFDEAVNNVWPVVTLFSRVSQDGTTESLSTAIQCVRASNGTTTAPSVTLSAAGQQFRVPTLAESVGLALAVLFGTLILSCGQAL